MVYFARMIFFLKNGDEPLNLTKTPKALFAKGDATCFAASSELFSPNGIVFTYGPFATREEATVEGLNLNRLIKLDMLKKGISISQETAEGSLDRPGVPISYDDPSDWERTIQHFPEKDQENARKFPQRIVNECSGIGIYEVEHSLDEIMFAGGRIQSKRRIEIKLQNRELHDWDETMDVSLAYLNASEEVRDSRVKLLLRIMAIEALVAKEAPRDAPYLEALRKLKGDVANLESTPDIRQRLSSQLGNLEKKGVREKVKDLISQWLPDRTYCGETAFKFFDRCYSARSKLIHSGETEPDMWKQCDGLKQLSLDMLHAKSKCVLPNSSEAVVGRETGNNILQRGY